MANRPEVIVVGAGALGVSCAHHLHERGAVVQVIERDGVAQATSTCGAGFVAYWAGGYVPQWGPVELACEAYGIRFYTELHTELPTFTFRRAGSLYLAATEGGWSGSVKLIADSTINPSRRVVDAADAAEIGQIVRREGVYGGVFDPEPVQVDARGAVRAMAARLRAQGVRVDEHTPAIRLVVDKGRIRGVETPHGHLAADAVVVSAAMWSNLLLRPHGVSLPYAPMGALRITTEPLGVPSTAPMLLVPDVAHAWLREERGGLLWGCAYTGRHRTAFLDADPPERLEQLPMDGLWETERTGRELAGAIPVLLRYRDFSYAQGAPCYTPDLLPLLGAVPGIDGLYVLGGDNEAGITHGPGLGRALADQICGEPPFVDVSRYRIERFGDRPQSAREVATAVANAEGGVFR